MARQVRFLTLTLAGFGRYGQPTRFELGGHSCTFTSPNELGKSTFLSGLSTSLFGPPKGRSKFLEFQRRYRSWSKPTAFWGELDFTVGDQHWRVRQNFDDREVKVWCVPSGGPPEPRYESRSTRGRKSSDPDEYSKLLEDWLGLKDRSVYEAMFTITQQSTVTARWQIDPRICSLVYSQAVERAGGELQAMYRKFREITRNTREHKIAVGSQGLRDGRNAGRLDQIVARIAELDSRLQEAGQHRGLLDQQRGQLAELERKGEELRPRLAGITQSLDNWRAWIELEDQMQPAVQSCERLQEANERCQQLVNSISQIRARLTGDFGLFENAPPDIIDRLQEYNQSDHEAEQNHDELARLRNKIVRLQETLETEFSGHRGRPDLPDKFAELRRLTEQLDSERQRLAELEQRMECGEGPSQSIEQQLHELAAWKAVGPDWQAQLAAARSVIQEFLQDHDQYQASTDAVLDETQHLEEQEERVAQLEAEYDDLTPQRKRHREALAREAVLAQGKAQQGRSQHRKLAEARREFEHRFAEFLAAPEDLPALWDRVHELRARLSEAQKELEQARADEQAVTGRAYWRHGLTLAGAVLLLICIVAAKSWFDWVAAALTICLVVAVQWIFRFSPDRVKQLRKTRQQGDNQHGQLRYEYDRLCRKLGQFLVPVEREAEWRRLWPTYCRDREKLDAEARQLPAEEKIAELAQKASEAEERLTAYDAESDRLLAESEKQLDGARADCQQIERELDTLHERLGAHTQQYFGADVDRWAAEPLEALPERWEPVLPIATADSPSLASLGQLVEWSRSLDDDSWSRFAENCRTIADLEEQLADTPERPGPSDADELADRVRTLEQQIAELTGAVHPFNADTDPGWLRDQWVACQNIEGEIARCQSEIESLHSPEPVAEQLEQGTSPQPAAYQTIAEYLEQFDHDVERIKEALGERAELQSDLSELEGQEAEILADSGVSSVEELGDEAGKAERHSGSIRERAQHLLEQASELREAVDAPPEHARQRLTELESRGASGQAELDELERTRAELLGAIRQAETDPLSDENTIRSELESLRTERDQLEAERDSVAQEFHEANRLMEELRRSERAALEGRITEYFADYSCTAGRYIELDDELRIGLRNEDGTRYTPDMLSHGARDQLYLAVYLATAAGFDLPFVLDDPFVNCDAERLAAIRACWDRLAPDHQLILLSHDPQLASWAPVLHIRQAA